MRPRDSGEPGRTATTLELFFDLVFVVAVSMAGASLHHTLSEGHVFDGIVDYVFVFWGIWWAWMNFTWFASSFDTDDWLYRVLTIVQMGGVLVFAAGIEPAFAGDHHLLVYGYVIMRVAMVLQWLRASRGAGAIRRATLIYAVGIAVIQVFWLVRLVLPEEAVLVALLILIVAELAVPIVAESARPTPWHPHHITERYGLFAIILLGESLLGSANAIIEAVHDSADLGPLIWIAALTLIATAALWWIYFWPPHHEAMNGFRSSLVWGYGHFFIFAAAGAFSAGIEVEIDILSHHSELHQPWASFAFTIPLAVFVICIWALAIRPYADRIVNIALPLAAVLVLVDPVLPVPFALTAVILAAAVAVLVWKPVDEGRRGSVV